MKALINGVRNLVSSLGSFNTGDQLVDPENAQYKVVRHNDDGSIKVARGDISSGDRKVLNYTPKELKQAGFKKI
jgi:hypothetical protein